MIEPKTELIATFKPDGEPASVTVVIDNGFDDLATELLGWVDADDEGLVGVIEIRREKKGYTAALPEFTGW